MEALFAKDTGQLFSCESSPGKSFYCPTTPQRLNATNKVAVLTPSASIRVQRASFSTSHPPAVTTRGGTALQDLHWEFAMKMQRDGCRVTAASGDGATSSNLTQPYDTPTNSPDTYNESWPSSCCSSQQTPPSRIKATPTNTQAPPTINSGALVFEDEGEKRGASLASLVERFRTAAPTSREEREREGTATSINGGERREGLMTSPTSKKEREKTFGSKGNLIPFRLPPGHSIVETDDISTSTLHNHNNPSYSDLSPQVSDNSLGRQSQRRLISRGSSLISSSSTEASSPPANNYFNSKGEASFEEDTAQMASRCIREAMNREDDILYQWRLRKKLEEARREERFVDQESRRWFQPSTSVTTAVSPLVPLTLKVDRTSHSTHYDGTPTKYHVHTQTARIAGNAIKREEREGDIRAIDASRKEVRSKGNQTTGNQNVPGSVANIKNQVVQTDPLTCAVAEVKCTACNERMLSNDDNLPPPSLSQQGERLGVTEVQSALPPPEGERSDSKSSSDDTEGEQKAASTNQNLISETTLNRVTQSNQGAATCISQVHTPSFYKQKSCGDDEGAGVEESSCWTITPCGSPDSPSIHDLDPLVNEVVGDRLFDRHSSTPSKSNHQATQNFDDSAVVSVPAVCPGCDVVCPTDEGSWEDDMNDDLLKLLIRKAHCFEAEIRRINNLLDQLESTTTDNLTKGQLVC